MVDRSSPATVQLSRAKAVEAIDSGDPWLCRHLVARALLQSETRFDFNASSTNAKKYAVPTGVQSVAAHTGWIPVSERMPNDETPVLILRNGVVRIGERRWERPTWEETFTAFRYWDDPENEGQEWHDHEVTHWMPLPSEQSTGEAPSMDCAVRDAYRSALTYAASICDAKVFDRENAFDNGCWSCGEAIRQELNAINRDNPGDSSE